MDGCMRCMGHDGRCMIPGWIKTHLLIIDEVRKLMDGYAT